MKNNLFTVLIISLFISCKSNTKQPAQDSLTVAQTSADAKTIIEKFGPIVQGVWVKSDYVDKVIKSRSPLAATDEANGATIFYINIAKIKGDSIKLMVGWGNHDGSELTLKFKYGSDTTRLLFGAGELGYSIKNSDTILTTYWRDEKDKSKIIATNYKRALHKQPERDLGYGMDYIINKGLIVGNYLFTDSAGITSQVNFKADGKVNGFYKFKNYGINIDLNSDAMDNLDEIRFDFDSKNHKSYSFKFDADTLKLYDTKPNADSSELVLDKLRYKLVNVK